MIREEENPAHLKRDCQRGQLICPSPFHEVLNHLNLTVTDPLETQEFLIKYFGLKPKRERQRQHGLCYRMTTEWCFH